MFLIINVATEFCALRQLHHEQNIETLSLRKTQEEDELVAKDGGEYCRVGTNDKLQECKQDNWYYCRGQMEKLVLLVKIFFIIHSLVIAWLHFSFLRFEAVGW